MQLFFLPLAITFAVSTPVPELPTLPEASEPTCELGARHVAAGTVISDTDATARAEARARRNAETFCNNQDEGGAVILSLETSVSGDVTTSVAHFSCEAQC